MTNTTTTNQPLTRRRMLLLAGAGTAGVALTACGSDTPNATPASTTERAAPAAPGTDAPTSTHSDAPGCVLTPEAIEGPFYTDVNLMRRDITEGRPGQALELRLKVVDSNDCTPLTDASVDVWHADAGGLYSAFPKQGDDENVDTSKEQFLRGVQNTDSSGVATFDTIYPGWYRTRTTHIHIKVHFADQTRITTQLYFPDDVTAEIYGAPAYAERGQKDTTNANDDFGGDDKNLLMKVTKEGDRYIATGTLGITRT